jgi:RNA polymerase sigma-70 factor (ECF subfamily)
MTLSDEELIRRFQSGEPGAFEGVVVRWNPLVLRLAYRLTGDLEVARDIRQIALLRTYDALASFGGRSRLSTWLYQVVLNLCRERRRRETRHDDALRRATPDEDRTVRAADGESETRETALRVAEAVRALPAPEREVVVLRHYQDLTFVEIAEIQNAPVSTVQSRMTRGLVLLRNRLKDLS